LSDSQGIELLGTDPEASGAAEGESAGASSQPDAQPADGTVGLIVRFAPVLLAAAIVEQALERLILPLLTAWSMSVTKRYPTLRTKRQDLIATLVAKENKPVVTGGLAVLLAVVAARLMDLYLLHNVGFFDVTTASLNLTTSTGAERWFDTFATGVVIAAGTKPLHDLGDRLRKAKN
jgi:hypothetical protein